MRPERRADDEAHILLALMGIRDWRAACPGMDRIAPHLLAARRIIGDQMAIDLPLKDQLAGGRQRAAIPGRRRLHGPDLRLADRIPRDQRGRARRREFVRVNVGHAIIHGPRNGLPARRIDTLVGNLHAAIDDGDIDEASTGIERHGRPVVQAQIARPHFRHRAIHIALTGIFDRAAGRQVNMAGPCHLADLVGRDQLAGLAVDHIEKAVLGRVQDDLAVLATDGQRRQLDVHRAVIIPRLVGILLIVPDIVAGLRVQRDD